jgi:hypothetical protein
MQLRFRIRPDQRAPASDQQAMADDPPPSASPVQPIKKVGCSDALSGGSSAPLAPSPSPPSHPTGFAGARVNKRPREADDLHDVPTEDEEKKSSSSPSPVSPGVPSSLQDDDSDMVNVPSPAPATSASAPTASMTSSSADASNATKTFVSVQARHDTLVTRAGIDCRSKDMLLVSVRVQANHPDGTPTIARQQYGTTDEMKRQCAIRFIGSKTGLDIQCPAVPKYLLHRGEFNDEVMNTLTPAQVVWHEDLMHRATLHFDVVRGENTDPESLAEVCEWLWAHLIKATGPAAANAASVSESSTLPLWTDPASITKSWADLLRPVGTRIISDRRPASDSNVPFHAYQLLLQGANKLLTHIIACQFASYSLLRAQAPEVAKEWDQLLRPDIVGRTKNNTANKTDSSPSDSDDDGWQQSRTTQRRAQQQLRRARSLPKRVAAFNSKYMIVGKVANAFHGETGLPLLALSTTIRIRAWQERYTSCLVGNFESMGCDVTDLRADPTFMKMSTGIPGLTPPNAAWCVNQHNGGADCTIFIREDSRDLLPTLNAKVKALFPQSTPQLSIKCSIQEANVYGRVLRNTPLRNVFLNDQMPVVRSPTSTRPKGGAMIASMLLPQSPPAPGSWAAAVLQGVKRFPDTPTLDHRPKKRQPAVAQSPPTQPQQQQQQQQQRPKQQSASEHVQPSPPSTQVPSNRPSNPDIRMSAAWQELMARNAEMEQRLDSMSAASASLMETITRNLDAVVAQLNDQRQALTAGMASMANQLAAQTTINDQFRLTLATIAQKLGLTEGMGVPLMTALPAMNSASASPARQNGSAVRNG